MGGIWRSNSTAGCWRLSRSRSRRASRHRLQQIQLLIEPFGPQTNSSFCNLGQPLGAMPRCVDGRTAARNGPVAIEGFDPSHDSADIFRESQIAAAQFFQGAQSVLSVIHRLELPATQQLRQLSGIDPVTLAAVLQQGSFADRRLPDG